LSAALQKQKKRDRRTRTSNKRNNTNKAISNEVGSRIIINPQLSRGVPVDNTRRCLLDALLSLITNKTIQNDLKQEFVRTMSSMGDTPISVGIKALSCHCMTLKHVTDQYNNYDERAFSLLQIREHCQLIVVVRLWSHKVGPNGETFADHCVAWDGCIIHDQPKSVRVNNSTDRANNANCRAVFERIFHPKDYAQWQIIQVFELISVETKNSPDAVLGTNHDFKISNVRNDPAPSGRKRRKNTRVRKRKRSMSKSTHPPKRV
jgi:hypothetical protein